MSPNNVFDHIEVAIAAIAAGGIVVVADDEHRENEGDLIMAADAATPEAIAFFVRHTSGVICAALSGAQCDRLALPLMVPSAENADQFRTAFTITVDLADGTSTGISAFDRASTLRALAHPSSTPDMFHRPGHIFPLRARSNGVLERPGHTEAAVDLARLAGRHPVGVLSELVLDDGRMARLPDLTTFAREHRLPLVSIADLIHHRRTTEPVGASL
jgi:3,4-dihydroxy 2-butanone 4-phosphate synthase/GTP cyclohydrolase II